MIVSEKKKFIFIHIYKTGGTSLTKVLSDYVDEKFLGTNTPRTEGLGWQSDWHVGAGQHMWFQSGINLLPKKFDFEPYFIFTFVRNPLSWLKSIYFEFYFPGRKINSHNKAFAEYTDDNNFNSFIDFLISDQSKGCWGHNRQVDFLKNHQGVEIDFCAKLENYDKDVRRIMAHIGVPIEEIPHLLKKGGGKKKILDTVSESITKETLGKINTYYKEDFERFGYPFL